MYIFWSSFCKLPNFYSIKGFQGKKWGYPALRGLNGGFPQNCTDIIILPYQKAKHIKIRGGGDIFENPPSLGLFLYKYMRLGIVLCVIVLRFESFFNKEVCYMFVYFLFLTKQFNKNQVS